MTSCKLAASNIAWSESDDCEILSFMESLGYRGLEIAPTRVLGENPYQHIDEAVSFVRGIKGAYGFDICSMQSIWYGQTGNIFNAAEREELLGYTKAAMVFAGAIDCGNLVFGCPKSRNMPDGVHPHDVDGFFMAAGAYAAELGTVLALEANPPIYGTNFLNSTPEVYDFLCSLPETVGLGINLDFGTIIANGESVEALRPFLPYVNHVHISEPHLAPVERRSAHGALRDLLQDAGYAGYVSLEMARAEVPVVKACLEYLAEVFA